MAMTLQATRLRLTQAIYFGHPPGGVVPGGPFVKTNGTTPLTANWNAGNFSITSHNSLDWVNAGAYGFTSAGIKAAIAATPYGGTCYLPAGTYTLADADLPIIRTTPISIVGAGLGTKLLVSATLGAGVDVFLLQPTNAIPTTDGKFWALRNFRITPAAGTPGRHAINLDATNGSFQNLLIENLSIDWLGGDAIHGDGAFGGGIPTLSTIRNSQLAGGIQLLTGGDTVRILDNGISMPFANHAGVDVTLVGGASTLRIVGNNIAACDGGCIHIGGVPYNVLIEDNEFETNVTFAGSNGAVVDIDGSASGTKILGNSFQVVNGATAIGLRINGGSDAYVAQNNFERGVGGSTDITIVAGTANTVIGPNMWISGGPFASMVSDAGTGTILDTEWQGKRLMTPGIGVGTTAPVGDLDFYGGPLIFQAVGATASFVSSNAHFVGGSYRYVQNGTANVCWISDPTGGIQLWTAPAGVAGALITPAPRVVIANTGEAGFGGVTTPTRTIDLNGTERFRGIAAPAVSEANSGTIYFDSALNKFRASLNGSAYVDLVGSAGLTGSGVANKLAYWNGATSLTDETNITLGGTYKLDISGDINFSNGSAIFVNSQRAVYIDSTGKVSVGYGNSVPGGSGSVGIGSNALGTTSTGINNTAVNGAHALTTGQQNACLGTQSLNTTTTGSDNTSAGYNSGATNTTGSNNVFVGSGADVTAGNLSNAVAIGYQATVAASDTMSLGNAAMKVGIHTTTAKTGLDVDSAVCTRHKNIAVANGLNSDIALTDTSLVRLTGPTGGFSIGGFTGGTDGRILRIINTTAEVMTIVNLDAGSAATNQITTLTGGNVVLAARTTAATFVYEDASDTWVLFSYNG